MSPPHLSTAAPTASKVRPAGHLAIIELVLPQQDSRRYDVMLRLCRPLTGYESHELIVHRPIGLDVSPDDPSQLIATHTTIEEVRDRLPEFYQLLTAAAADGHAAQDRATRAQEVLTVEETRRQKLVTDTNIGLGACPHTHDPAVDAK